MNVVWNTSPGRSGVGTAYFYGLIPIAPGPLGPGFAERYNPLRVTNAAISEIDFAFVDDKLLTALAGHRIVARRSELRRSWR